MVFYCNGMKKNLAKMNAISLILALLAIATTTADAKLRAGGRNLKIVPKERRTLQSLSYRGADPSFRLGQCEGDCDNNSDCQSGLVCFQKDSGGSGQVPGCSGRDSSRNDFCIDPSDLGSTPTAPSPTAPAPTSSSPRTALFNYGASPPSSVFPLGVCEGDCDVDSDCAGNLRCLQRDSNAGSVPGCNGSDNGKTDYCVSRSSSPSPPSAPGPTPTAPSPTSSSVNQNFKLKMYWEEGYFWQEERFERKWCMRCRGGSCSTGEKLYIEECDDSGVEKFDFDYVSNDEVLIKINGSNNCLERAGRDIFVRSCDSGKSLQRWWAKTGDFDESRFEISQLGATNLCVTQRHHPKPDEEVELEPCTQARESDTSFWTRCYSNSC